MTIRGSILIIDDEESMRDSCCQALRRVGYQAEAAENGDCGLRRINEVTPDLVLVDLKMPGMSGLEVLDRITKTNPSIVRVVITGYGTIESAVEAMKLGASDFVCKPFTPEELNRVVEQGLTRRRPALPPPDVSEEGRQWREEIIPAFANQLGDIFSAIERYLKTLAKQLTSGTAKENERKE